jgi:hypothetical protein
LNIFNAEIILNIFIAEIILNIFIAEIILKNRMVSVLVVVMMILLASAECLFFDLREANFNFELQLNSPL